MLERQLNKILMESDKAFVELKKLAATVKGKKDAEWIDKFYTNNEEKIEKLVKKYKLDWDELGAMLAKL